MEYHAPVAQRKCTCLVSSGLSVRIRLGAPYDSLVQLEGYRTFNPGDVGSNPTGITIVPVAQRAEAAGLNPAKCRFDSYQEHQ